MDWRIGSRADATFIEVGWVKPTQCSLIYIMVGFTHPSALVSVSNQQGESPCQSGSELCNRK